MSDPYKELERRNRKIEALRDKNAELLVMVELLQVELEWERDRANAANKRCMELLKMINFDGGADKTDDNEDCGNKGCGFNIAGKCTASVTECFGYIDPDLDS